MKAAGGFNQGQMASGPRGDLSQRIEQQWRDFGAGRELHGRIWCQRQEKALGYQAIGGGQRPACMSRIIAEAIVHRALEAATAAQPGQR